MFIFVLQERVSGKDGRRRFDPDGNSPYAYVKVLLYTQQFEAAVSFLHWKGHHVAVSVDWPQFFLVASPQTDSLPYRAKPVF